MAHVRRARRTEAAGALKGAGAILAVFAAGFIIGRVKISDDLWPFGTAFVIAAFLNGNRVNPYAALAGVLAALATQITEMGNVAYHFSVVTICAVILIGYSCVKGRPGKRVATVSYTHLDVYKRQDGGSAVKGQHVMLAKGVEGDVLLQHHVVLLHMEALFQMLGSAVAIAGSKLLIHPCDSVRGFQKALSVAVSYTHLAAGYD